MKLLMVEDSEPVRVRLVHALAGMGVTVRTAGTVAEARVELGEATDLLSVDLHLPDGSGLELIEHAAKLARRPVIFVLTATPELAERAVGVGADRVFDKGTDIGAYLNAIEEATEEEATEARTTQCGA